MQECELKRPRRTIPSTVSTSLTRSAVALPGGGRGEELVGTVRLAAFNARAQVRAGAGGVPGGGHRAPSRARDWVGGVRSHTIYEGDVNAHHPSASSAPQNVPRPRLLNPHLQNVACNPASPRAPLCVSAC